MLFPEMTAYSYKGLVERYFNTDMYSEENKAKYNQYLMLVDKRNRTDDDEKKLAKIRKEFSVIPKGVADELVLAFELKEMEQEYGKD